MYGTYITRARFFTEPVGAILHRAHITWLQCFKVKARYKTSPTIKPTPIINTALNKTVGAILHRAHVTYTTTVLLLILRSATICHIPSPWFLH